MLNWSSRFSIFLFLDSNDYSTGYDNYECLLAANSLSIIDSKEDDALTAISKWHSEHKDWLFGHICYDYKNSLEPRLRSKHKTNLDFPLLQFFCPQIVCYVDKDKSNLTIESMEVSPREVYGQITNCEVHEKALSKVQFTQRVSKDQYLTTIQQLRTHIADGDCYEINFCCEGYSEQVLADPLAVFSRLNHISPAPFAAYYRLQDQYMICASPERYLRKEGRRLLSQPIKGTAKRDTDKQIDEANKLALQESIKDRAENVMIVDLVRNDLARSCETGTVKVDELFGIYSFPQVHQMISTVSGTLKRGADFTDAIRYSFPMGSMTGAPKVKVMELIEQYEQSRRELFSGTVGYITPEGNFDFNVIIRSLFYNSVSQYLSYQTGGAITYDSDAMQEWDEMRLKAWALERIFS